MMRFALLAVGLGGLGLSCAPTRPLPCDPSNSIYDCDGRCSNLQSDLQNCGVCGRACGDGLACAAGMCQHPNSDQHLLAGDPGVWTTVGPWIGGRLDAVVAANVNTLLVGAPGGGLWRTTNGGGSWIPALQSGLADLNITHLEYDRVNSSNLFVTTFNGLYSTTDLGDHLTPLVNNGGLPAPLMPLRSTAGSSHTTDAYAFAQMVVGGQRIVLYAPPCSGLYYSYDGVNFSHNWPNPNGGSNLVDNCIQSITGDDTTGVVYFSTLGGGFYYPMFRSQAGWTSTTPNLTWLAAGTGLPNNSQVNAIVATSNAGGGVTYPNRINLVANVGGGATIYETQDGYNWLATIGQPAPGDSWDPRPLSYPGGNDLFAGTVVEWESQNMCGVVSEFPNVGEHGDIRSFFFGYGYLWDTTDGSGNADQASNLTRWNWSVGSPPSSGVRVGTDGISAWQPYFMEATAASNSSGRRIYLGSQDNGLLCSDDQGAHWVSQGLPGSTGDSLALRFAPSQPGRAFYMSNDDRLWYSNNANASACSQVTWTSFYPGFTIPTFWNHNLLAVHPTNANKVYVVDTYQHIDVVNIGGTSSLVTTPVQASALFVDSNGTLFIGTLGGGIYRSTNDGVTWTAFGLNSGAPAAVMEMSYSPVLGGGTGTYFAATTSGLYRLAAGGSWTLVLGGGGYVVSAVIVDPTCPSRLYAGLGFAGGMGQQAGGVYTSTDNGVTWRVISAGYALQLMPVSALQVDPVDARYVYAASYGMGGWIYDNGSTPICSGGFSVFAGPQKCIDVVNGNAVPGAQLQILGCTGNGEQSFVMGGNHQLQSAINPGLCLEVRYADYNAGYVQLWTCNGTPAQQWTFVNGQVHPYTRTDKCLDVSGNSRNDGTLIDLASCSGSPKQQFWPWGFAGVNFESGLVYEYFYNLCLDVWGDRAAPGAILDNYYCAWGDSQTFTLTPQGQITFHGLCVEDYSVQPNSYGSVQLNNCNGGLNQSWSYLTNLALSNWAPTNYIECLDVNAASSYPSTVLDVWMENGGPQQLWQMELREF